MQEPPVSCHRHSVNKKTARQAAQEFVSPAELMQFEIDSRWQWKSIVRAIKRYPTDPLKHLRNRVANLVHIPIIHSRDVHPATAKNVDGMIFTKLFRL